MSTFGHCDQCGGPLACVIVETAGGKQPLAVGLICTVDESHGPDGPRWEPRRDKGLAPLWALAERLHEEGDALTARRAYPSGVALRHCANRIRNTLRFIEDTP